MSEEIKFSGMDLLYFRVITSARLTPRLEARAYVSLQVNYQSCAKMLTETGFCHFLMSSSQR